MLPCTMAQAVGAYMSAQSELQSENCEYSQYQNIHNFHSEFTLRRRVGEMTYAPTAQHIVKYSALPP